MAWTDLTYAFGSLLTSAKMTQNQANFEAMAQGASGAPRVLGTDNWFRMNGQDGSLTVNSDTIIEAGIYHHTFVQVNSGKTVTVTSGGTLVWLCSSVCNIEGTIDLSGLGSTGGAGGTGVAENGFVGQDGHTGSGGGGGAGAGAAGDGGDGGDAINWAVTINGGAGATTGNGNIGITHPNSRTPIWHFGDIDIRRCGAGGGGGGADASGGDGGAGGDGGGEFIIASPSILVDSFGVIDISGDAGNVGVTNGAGGGGGAGGRVQIIVSTESYTNVGSINISGGTGGAGAGTGGDGGDGATGLSEIIQLA